jgi:hypothetical protein
MNQYRCKTCKNYEDDEGKSACNIREEWIPTDVWNWIKVVGCASHSDFQNQKEKVLDEYNDELLTKLVQELAGTWRMRDAKLFSIIRKYRRVPIGAMKAELRQSKGGAP